MIIATVLAIVWLAIGYERLSFEGGWLIMITDKRNTKRTWLAIPSVIVCVILWPINRWVARWCFMLSIW